MGLKKTKLIGAILENRDKQFWTLFHCNKNELLVNFGNVGVVEDGR